ncbi:MAG TPA: hypothetical protein VK549_03955 [Acidimicrobiia bacterium]|nr:hypothetical protein [Acidimicrobiia bacterium]
MHAIGTRARTATRTALLALTVVALSLGAFGCGSDDSSPGSRNSSNFNTRSIATFGTELPTMANSRTLTRGTVEGGAWHKTYEVGVPAGDVLAFYERELPSTGWNRGGTPATTPGGFEATWRRTGLRLDVTVSPSATTSGSASPAATSPPSSASSTANAGGNAGGTTVNLSISRTTGN